MRMLVLRQTCNGKYLRYPFSSSTYLQLSESPAIYDPSNRCVADASLPHDNDHLEETHRITVTDRSEKRDQKLQLLLTAMLENINAWRIVIRPSATLSPCCRWPERCFVNLRIESAP